MVDKTKLAFVVAQTRAGWTVRADGFVYPVYSNFSDALAGAIREARAAARLGFASRVLAQPVPGRPFETQWVCDGDETGIPHPSLAVAPGRQAAAEHPGFPARPGP